MSRAIQIFRKDVAHLRPQILAFVGLLVAFVIDDRSTGNFSAAVMVNLSGLLFLALPLSCWLLVTSLIHIESAVGDRQYWLTRPFNRADLLAAKALFLAAFLLAPVFICQAFVLTAMPQSPGFDGGALVAKQVFFLAWYLLPIAAVAAVTRNLGEAILGSLLVFLVYGTFMSIGARPGWNGLTWIRETLAGMIALSGAALVIYLQYTRRATILSRCVLAGGLLLVGTALALPPFQAAFRVQCWLSSEPVDPHAVRISFDPRQSAAENVYDGGPFVDLWIPVKVDDVPPGLDIVADWISMDSPWRSGWSGFTSARVGSSAAPLLAADLWTAKPGRSLRLAIPASAYQRFKDNSVRLRGSLDLTLVAPSAPQCHEQPDGSAYCLWNPQVFTPFPTSPWFSPLGSYAPQGIRVPSHPVAHIQRSFDLGPLRLTDYVEKK